MLATMFLVVLSNKRGIFNHLSYIHFRQTPGLFTSHGAGKLAGIVCIVDYALEPLPNVFLTNPPRTALCLMPPLLLNKKLACSLLIAYQLCT